jgi:hypothetical protein
MHTSASVDRSPIRPARALSLFALVAVGSLVHTSCTGVIGEPGTRPVTPVTPSGDGGGLGDAATLADSATPSTPCPEPPSLHAYLRRLSRVEYLNSARVLFGGAPSNLTSLLPTDSEVNGFDNNAESTVFGRTRAEQFRDAARAVADWVIDPARRDTIVRCNPGTDAACVRSFFSRVGRLAFRRPLETVEIDALVAVAAVANDDPNPYVRIRLATQAMLRSPSFLFRMEPGMPVGDRGPMSVKLSGYEMASRLSFLFLRSTPTSALLDAAQSGALDTQEGVAAQAEMMLASPEVRASMREFFVGWLRLNKLASVRPNAMRFPQFNDGMRSAMREETLRLADDLAWRDGGDLRDLLTARYTFINDALAPLYGAPTTGRPDEWRRLDFPMGSQRTGVLTQPGVLAMNTADHGVLTIIRRGVWALDVFMCDVVRLPPGMIPALPPPMPGQSDRDLLSYHRRDPACAACHDRMDPMGLAFSGYDDIGAVTMRDSRGLPVDTSGSIEQLMIGSFSGPAQLAPQLRQHPAVSRCMAKQMFRYAFGRSEGDGDNCAVAAMERALRENNFSFRAMIRALVRSDAFRYRAPSPDSTGGM